VIKTSINVCLWSNFRYLRALDICGCKEAAIFFYKFLIRTVLFSCRVLFRILSVSITKRYLTFRCSVPPVKQADDKRGVRLSHEQASPGCAQAALHPGFNSIKLFSSLSISNPALSAIFFSFSAITNPYHRLRATIQTH